LDLEPTHQKSLVKKGNVLGKFGKYLQAVSYYNLALEQDQEDLLALLNKGLALHYLENYDEAISCYDKALQIQPHNTIALYNKCSSLIRKNQIKEGLEILQKAIRLDFSYKAKARYDIDFFEISHLDEFQKLVSF
jgi:tetratricopeptide (TPR) repeat protein